MIQMGELRQRLKSDSVLVAVTVKPVLSGHSKKDKTKILMTNGSCLKRPLKNRQRKILMTNGSCLKRPLKKKTKIGFQDRLSLNAGQKYCRMEHSAIFLTFIKLPFVIKILCFVYF